MIALLVMLALAVQAAPGSQIPAPANQGRAARAEQLADQLLAAPAEQWPEMLAAEDPAFVLGPLRMTVLSRGSRAAAAQHYADALVPFALLRAIGRFAHTPDVQLEALQNLGTANFFLRRYQDAADAYAEEVTLARAARETDYEASALDGVAMVAYSRGDYGAALEGYRAALDLAERRAEPAPIARGLVSVGNVQYLQGDYDLAATSYRRAVTLLAAAPDNQTLAMAWRGAARVYTAQGDLASALVAQTHALTDARGRAALSEVANDQEQIGELHFKLGNLGEARSTFESARQMFEGLHDPEGAGRLLGDIGLTELVAERFDAAVAAYTQSRDRFQQAKDPAGIGHAWVGIGFSEAGRARFPDAIDAYKVAIGIFDANHRDEDAGRAWLGLSLAHYASADYDSALRDAARVAAIAAAIHNDDLTWRAHVRSGDALRRLGRLGEAREEFDAAISMIGAITALAATSAEARTMLEDSGSAWAGLAFTRAQQGDAEGALLAAEQRRSHLVRVMLAPFERDVTRGMTSGDIEAERAGLRAIVSLTAERRAERASPRPDHNRLTRIEQQLASAVAARDREQHALYHKRPDLALWRGLRPVNSVDQLASALDVDMTAVEFIAEDDELLVLTASRDRRTTDDGLFDTRVTASVVPWQRHDFALSIARAIDRATLTDARGWAEHAKPIADVLMPLIASQLTDKTRLVIVPDDVLWSIPFEALPFASSDLESLVDVSYVSSLYTLALRSAVRDEGEVSFIAAPVLARDTEAQLAAAVPTWVPEDPDAVRREVEAQARAYGEEAHVVTGSDATQTAALASLGRASMLEIGARLQLSGATPLFSCALLSPSPAEPTDDGRWELREWFNGSGRGAAMVLPDTGGVGAGGLGAAIMALDWASAAAGTSAVLVARPRTSAFDPASVLRAFHASRAAGVPLEPAYRAAVFSARQLAAGAPSGWAALRVVGRLR